MEKDLCKTNELQLLYYHVVYTCRITHLHGNLVVKVQFWMLRQRFLPNTATKASIAKGTTTTPATATDYATATTISNTC
jgi:hypothetical protein